MRGSISCVILKFKPIDAVFFNTAFSNTLRPCGLTFPRTTRNRKSAVPQNCSRSLFAPRRPVLAGFYPRWGNDPPPPGQGLVWAPQGPVWQKEKKTAHPSGWGKIWGCEKRAGERPGVAGGVPCRVPSPGRAERDRIFARRQFPRFPGSVWRFWGHGRGQKTRISRWQAIFPGVTAGVNERMKKKWQKKT